MKRKKVSKSPSQVFTPGRSKYLVISFSYFKNWFLTFLGLGLFVGLFLWLRSSFFQIQSVNCFKQSFPCSEEEMTAFSSLAGENIFFFDIQKAKEEFLAENSQISQVSFNRRLPNSLEVNLVGRKPAFIITTDKVSWFLVDEKGVLISRAKPSAILPKIVFPQSYQFKEGKQLKSSFSQKVFILAKTLKLFFVPFDELEVEFPDCFSLQTGETKVIFSSQKSVKFQVASLQLILSRSRIEGKIPIKVDFRFDKPILSYN